MSRPEFELIDWVRSQVQDRDSVRLGIGDDAAVLRPPAGREILVATDMLMEGVHFEFPTATPRLVGRKALAVNLSDIAAMGARPTSAFVSVALPVDRGLDFAKDVHAGLLELANAHGVILAGGDTNSWRGPLVINVAVLGEPIGPSPIRRSGAIPGDVLFVTGQLGGSLAGRHLTFPPRLAEVAHLLAIVTPHAMMDISDGLAADLPHLLKAGQTTVGNETAGPRASRALGAILDADKIPIHTDVSSNLPPDERLLRALGDGEDFELLFCVPPQDADHLESHWHHPTPLTRIGLITDTPATSLRSPTNHLTPLPTVGWTHRL